MIILCQHHNGSGPLLCLLISQMTRNAIINMKRTFIILDENIQYLQIGLSIYCYTRNSQWKGGSGCEFFLFSVTKILPFPSVDGYF